MSDFADQTPQKRDYPKDPDGIGHRRARASRPATPAWVRWLFVLVLLGTMVAGFTQVPSSALASDTSSGLIPGQCFASSAVSPAEIAAEDYGSVSGMNSKTLEMAQTGVAEFQARLVCILRTIPLMPGDIVDTLTAKSPTGDPMHFLKIVLVMVAALFFGFLVEKHIYGRQLVGPWFIAMQRPNPKGYAEKVPILALRVLLSLGGLILTSLISTVIAYSVLDDKAETGYTILVIIATFAIIRGATAIWRMALSPFLSEYRIPCFSDEAATRLFYWMVFGAILGIGSLAFCVWMEALGVSKEAHVLMTSGLTLLSVFYSLTMIRRNQADISYAIRGGCSEREASWPTRTATTLWAPFVSLYLIIAWAEMTYRLVDDQPIGVPLIVGAYTILTVLLAVYGGIAYVIDVLFERSRMVAAANAAAAQAEAAAAMAAARAADTDGDGAEIGIDLANVSDATTLDTGAPAVQGGTATQGPMATPGPTAATGFKLDTFEELARRVASVIAVFAGIYALLWIWAGEIDVFKNFGLVWFADMAIVAFAGYILYQAVRIAIDRRIAEEGGEEIELEPGDEGGAANAATRLATLLPLFRNFLLFTISAITILAILLEIGVNVTPIFAGAGVVGLAIGFGAQALVRDIFSGIFFLVDDAFRKGEYIDIGEVKGTVEKISVRSFQLRHHLGYLHTIPFGEIRHLTNYSRDWVMMKLPLRLTYDTDVDQVRKLIKKLGQHLQEDPEIGEKFLQPLKSQGVYQMEDSAMIIRVKFMTRPGEQWVIRKRVYAELRALFEREGIKFAHREVTVRLADEGAAPGANNGAEAASKLDPKQREALGGVLGPLIEGQPKPAAVGDDR